MKFVNIKKEKDKNLKTYKLTTKNDNITNKNEDFAKKVRDFEEKFLIYEKGKGFDYDVFYTDLRLFLRKLPKGHVSETVMRLINLNGIFVGAWEKKLNEMPLYSRSLVTLSDKLAGILLSVTELNINEKGETNNIDNCVYAAYSAILRGALIAQDSKFKLDFDLHKLGMTYLYAIILKNLGVVNAFNKFQLEGIQLGCAYIYLRHYLSFNHVNAMSRMSRLFSDIISKETINKYSDGFELCSRYKSMKEIGKVLFDLKVTSTNPNALILSLLQNYGKEFVFHLLAPVDYLFSAIILSRYPTDLIGRISIINGGLQKSIEDLVIDNYYKKLGFEILPILK
jgi:hypothetical protein